MSWVYINKIKARCADDPAIKLQLSFSQMLDKSMMIVMFIVPIALYRKMDQLQLIKKNIFVNVFIL